MLENVFILLEILAFGMAYKGHLGFSNPDRRYKNTIYWILSAVLFSILAMSSYGIEVTLSTGVSSIVQTPLAWLNWGFSALMIFMFFVDTFDKGF